MPDVTAIAGWAAGVITLIGIALYLFTILRGGTRPNRTTWWIWTVVGFMLGASYYSSGANHTIWVPVGYIIGPFAAAILSIKYGEGGWTWFDRYCLLVAGISVVLWVTFRSPLVALLINLSIDFIGALPTIRKAYRDPGSENRIAWALVFAGNTVNLFAVETWTFAIFVYPIYMFLGSGLLTALIFVRRRIRQ